MLSVSTNKSAVVSSATATLKIPALLTRMSGAPLSSDLIFSAARSTFSGSLTSAWIGIAPLISAARSLSVDSVRAIRTTRTPCSPSALAMPAPIPLDAPVTTAVRPPSGLTI